AGASLAAGSWQGLLRRAALSGYSLATGLWGRLLFGSTRGVRQRGLSSSRGVGEERPDECGGLRRRGGPRGARSGRLLDRGRKASRLDQAVHRGEGRLLRRQGFPGALV